MKGDKVAKRFTDNNKWEDDWFAGLPPKYKLFWMYICDRCDHAGFWKPSAHVASALIGENIDIAEAENLFQERIQVCDGLWWLKKFCSFQYGKLNPLNKTHASVLKLLSFHGILMESLGISENIRDSRIGLKDTVKDKDEEKVKDTSLREYTNYFSQKYLEKYGQKLVSIQGHWIALQNFVKDNEIPLDEFRRRVDNYFSDSFNMSHNQLSFISKWPDMIHLRQTREQAAEETKKRKAREELLKDMRRNR
jgi:hypothetical protein